MVKDLNSLPQFRNKARVYMLIISIDSILMVITSAVRQDKGIKCIESIKKKFNLPLFTDDVIVSIENPTEFCSWITRHNIIRSLHSLQMIYRFNPIAVKIVVDFVEINKLILKFRWKYKGSRIAKIYLNKKIKVRGHVLSDVKVYTKL